MRKELRTKPGLCFPKIKLEHEAPATKHQERAWWSRARLTCGIPGILRAGCGVSIRPRDVRQGAGLQHGPGEDTGVVGALPVSALSVDVAVGGITIQGISALHLPSLLIPAGIKILEEAAGGATSKP